MGVRLLENKRGRCCFYDSVDGMAFGPVFVDRVVAEAFERWVLDQWEVLRDTMGIGGRSGLPPDLRSFAQVQLKELFDRFARENPAALGGGE